MITDKTYSPVLRLTIQAAESLPAYRFVNFTGNLCTEGEKALGVTDYPALSGELVSLIVLGSAILECDGVVSTGDKITASSLGKVKLLETGVENGYAISGNSGDYATIILK